MKKTSIILLLVIGLSISCKNEGDTNLGPYTVQQAIIKSKTEMMGIESKSVLYFKDYGNTECSEGFVKHAGQKTHSRRFIRNGYAYTLDMKKKKGSKMKETPPDANTIYPEDIDFSNIPEKITEKYAIEEIGTEKVAGKNCKIYSMQFNGVKQKISVWENVPVKVILNDHGTTITTQAYEIIENPEFPAGIFSIPENFEIQEYTPEGFPKQDKPEENPDNPA
ncbi:MAG: hypothetical protein U9N85_02790 [Bacteroidota bacterium]|nr:hypothetical protein [Bacteroidota bacterium]